MSDAPLRVFDTGLRPARWNVAASAVLAERHAAGATGALLRFHRYPPSVLIGRHQDAHAAARPGAWEIARRVTGGGAVYMDPGVLAWELLATGRDAAGLARTTGECVARALAKSGIAAEFVPPNDVRIAAGKVSGSAGLAVGATLLVQGTLVASIDRAALDASLAAPGPQRVASLAEHLPAVPDSGSLARAIAAEIAQALGREPVDGDLSAEEEAGIERALADEYGRDDFVFGATPERERKAS